MRGEATANNPELLAQLRAGTAGQHRLLDGGIALGQAGAVDPLRYTAFLRATARVLDCLEPAVQSLVPLDPPARTEALRADLSALGAEPAAPARLPVPTSRAAAYGCAYVLEGSTLGGMVLARAVEASLHEQAPTRYLRLRGERTAGSWRSFLEQLHEFDRGASAAERTEAVAAARATFEAYIASFREAGVFRG
jgi:heme oxygenase